MKVTRKQSSTGSLDFLNYMSVAHLNLSYNWFAGNLGEVNSLRNAKVVDVSHNVVEGSLDAWGASHDSLEWLDMSNNKLVARLWHIRRFHKLKHIDLSHNWLEVKPQDFPADIRTIKVST